MTVKHQLSIAAPLAALLAASIPAAASAQAYPAPDPYGQDGYNHTPGYGYPPSGYDGGPQGAYAQPPQSAYDAPPPPDGYDGSAAPPPPPGWQASGDYAVTADQDRRYQAYAEDWAQSYCVRSRGNAGAGAVIGGLFGALLGSGVAGWHDRGTGALVGGLAGAGVGAAVGSTTANQTSPGCPPGYVVRGGAPAFAYGGYGAPYYYAAPDWYRPWYYYGGRWQYRPYPYHAYYYRTFGFSRPYGYGYRDYGWRGYGYRGGYGYRHGWRR